ncbi:MAG: vWA domain-containing protein [Promethearchaeota archaeon]|jgi:uncharacterized protein YegL
MRLFWFIILLLVSPLWGQQTEQVYRDNVIMVVDASGSMGDPWTGTDDQKMGIARQAMNTVLEQVDENTQIGILVFGGSRSNWIYPLGPKNDAALIEAIEGIRTGGGTPLGTNIKKAADTLMLQRDKQFSYGSYRLLIVTDGEASGSGEVGKMEKYTPEVIARGINVNVIGVDMGKEHALAKLVGDHRYRAADNPASLTKAIEAVFGEVSRQDADDSASSFELLEGIDSSLAKEMIGALAKVQNHPIGEKPKPKVPLRPQASNQNSSGASWDTTVVENDDSSPGLWIGGGVLFILAIIGAVKVASRH